MTLITFKQKNTFSVLALPDINTRGSEEFETVMQTRDKVEGLLNGIPAPQVFISVYANTGKRVFYCFFKIISPRRKAKLLRY